jgi:hypothetical protein
MSLKLTLDVYEVRRDIYEIAHHCDILKSIKPKVAPQLVKYRPS